MLADEIRLGLAVSDARPAGNVTGLLMRVPGMAGKQIEWATETVPAARRVGILSNPTSADAAAQRQEVDAAILARSAQAIFVEAGTPAEIEGAMNSLHDAQVDIAIVLYDALFFTNRRRIADLAAAARIAMVYSARDHVEAGGLISYGINLRANARRSATYVDKILRGEKPGDLPIEFPTSPELVINLKTARALGIIVPPTLLARADEVIE
jgi:putative ABC transport system substrate-binding protein